MSRIPQIDFISRASNYLHLGLNLIGVRIEHCMTEAGYIGQELRERILTLLATSEVIPSRAVRPLEGEGRGSSPEKRVVKPASQ
jgi:hypothetical protein